MASTNVDSGIDSREGTNSPKIKEKINDEFEDKKFAPIFRRSAGKKAASKPAPKKRKRVKLEPPSSSESDAESDAEQPKRKRKTKKIKEEEEEDVKPDAKILFAKKYKREIHGIFVPEIKAHMIDQNGGMISTSTEDFKFIREPRSKESHADEEMVRKIIKAVQKWPIIWDQRLLCHSSVKFSRRAWLMVEKDLGNNPEYPLKRLKQIWKNKKDYYVAATHSGTIGTDWKYAKEMEFYKPCINYRLLHSKMTTEESDIGLGEKYILAYKSFKCRPTDSDNVLKFLLKIITEAGQTGPETLKTMEDTIITIFTKNFEQIVS